MTNDSWDERARRIEQRLQELAGITYESGMLTRTFLSPPASSKTKAVVDQSIS